MPETDFEKPLARAAEEGAKRALGDFRRDGTEAALDIRDLRSLLGSTTDRAIRLSLAGAQSRGCARRPHCWADQHDGAQ